MYSFFFFQFVSNYEFLLDYLKSVLDQHQNIISFHRKFSVEISKELEQFKTVSYE